MWCEKKNGGFYLAASRLGKYPSLFTEIVLVYTTQVNSTSQPQTVILFCNKLGKNAWEAILFCSEVNSKGYPEFE